MQGILGMPGSTAYGGLIDILKPVAGQTLFVSAASGAVGSVVGMIAKNVYGCTIIGSCGGPEKCSMLKEKFGYDHAIDYKTCANADELTAALKVVAPDGIDMYFENVGGMHFDAAFSSLKTGGRIAICGAISEYNNLKPSGNTIDITKMIYTAQRIEGFVCMPWLSGARGNFLADMAQWYKEGKLLAQETFTDGIENWPLAFQSLFNGMNKGKVIVWV
jgi:NADPH-dependent curcumin reductase CurA